MILVKSIRSRMCPYESVCHFGASWSPQKPWNKQQKHILTTKRHITCVFECCSMFLFYWTPSDPIGTDGWGRAPVGPGGLWGGFGSALRVLMAPSLAGRSWEGLGSKSARRSQSVCICWSKQMIHNSSDDVHEHFVKMQNEDIMFVTKEVWKSMLSWSTTHAGKWSWSVYWKILQHPYGIIWWQFGCGFWFWIIICTNLRWMRICEPSFEQNRYCVWFVETKFEQTRRWMWICKHISSKLAIECTFSDSNVKNIASECEIVNHNVTQIVIECGFVDQILIVNY